VVGAVPRAAGRHAGAAAEDGVRVGEDDAVQLTDDELRRRLDASPWPNTRWRHCRGEVVEIMTAAVDEETGEALVLFRNPASPWTRALPLALWEARFTREA
jgi:hypothetical protein